MKKKLKKLNNWNVNTNNTIFIPFQIITESLSPNNLKSVTTSATTCGNFGQPMKNGFACPSCKSELFDLEPNVIYASDPAKKKIGCKKCDYQGYRNI